ncbi:peptidase M16 family protein [Arthrobacter sp. TMS2-4]
MLQTVNRDVHRGISSYWLDEAGMCAGTLIFGVGFRNEPVGLAGVTHLVEHLVLRRVHPTTVRHGGVVDTNTTQFHAFGSPDGVADFLNRVADVITGFADLTDQDLALEKATIRAENPWAYRRLSAGLLTNRFGAEGPGIGQFGAPATTGFSREEAIEWTRTWFTRHNAAVTFSGHLPDELDLQLPPGKPTVRTEPTPLITVPTLVLSEKAGVALSLIVPLRHAGLLADALVYELRERLGHDQGLIYSVEPIMTVLGSDSVQLELVLDPIEENTRKTLKKALTAVRDIADRGFSPHAVDAARHAYVADLAWDHTVPTDFLEQTAVDGLFGRTTPTREALLDLASGTDAQTLTALLKASLETLMLAIDRDVEIREQDGKYLGLTVDASTMWEPYNRTVESTVSGITGELQAWRNKNTKSTLQLTGTHLIKHAAARSKAITLADVVLVGDRTCGGIALMDRRGRTTELKLQEWRRNKSLRKALLKAFPGAVVRAFPAA